MFEALIIFAEESVFGLVNRILSEETGAASRCEKILTLLLGFSERNPGITRVLLGDALVGESERLHTRVGQFFNRFETQLKQVLREGEQRSEFRVSALPEAANLLMAAIEGRMVQFRRSGFSRKPTDGWSKQWAMLSTTIFGS